MAFRARRRTFEFFYAHCLTKLGEPKEAGERLALFDKAHRIEWTTAAIPPSANSQSKQTTAEPPSNDPAQAWSSPKSRHEAEKLVAIAKALSIAQVFLSIDEPDAARTWFTQRLESSDDRERQGDLMALSQLSLLGKNNRDYATLVTDKFAPFLATTLEDPPPNEINAVPDSPAAVRTTLAVLAGHSHGPLFSDAFLKELPTEFVGQLVPKWEAVRSQSRSQLATLYADLVLRAAAVRLGHEKDRSAATARIVKNPFSSRSMLSGQLELYFHWLRPPVVSPPRGQI